MKWRLFRHLRHGGDEDAERVYRWHIEERSGARLRAGLPTDRWKRSLDDYVQSACRLFNSMERDGFRAESPIPLDIQGELLDAGHRVACAIALGLEAVPIERQPRAVWAPPWGLPWFEAHGMPAVDILRLKSDWSAMQR